MVLNKNIKTISCSAISALVSFVIVFNLSFNAFHFNSEEHHHVEAQTCSPNEENDACHRFLIHHEKSHSCDGRHEHFSKKADDCFVCNYFKNQHQFFEKELPFVFISQFVSSFYSSKESKPKNSFPLSFFSRGPPAIS